MHKQLLVCSLLQRLICYLVVTLLPVLSEPYHCNYITATEIPSRSGPHQQWENATGMWRSTQSGGVMTTMCLLLRNKQKR